MVDFSFSDSVKKNYVITFFGYFGRTLGEK